ncbi:helix-turn-helix domain-containing protein [Corynebacterium phoceense]|uniref:helix-turn-helix domain-containing protein n=1 Tax=Corynebacterium phoceense TaxID=1686286 RepID=UPI00211C01A5|nr:helix-turn-helix transcriptional regulator [Corynebacterium phoceense]MCQ9339563.1 helix-turn-helix domain-containing protein [Corynebacterium phoceense]
MDSRAVGARINEALVSTQLSQRALADRTGLAQSTLSRIVNGTRTATMPELVRIAAATGTTVGLLTGTSDAPARVQYAARSTNGSTMTTLRDKLISFVEINDYLTDQGFQAEQ